MFVKQNNDHPHRLDNFATESERKWDQENLKLERSVEKITQEIEETRRNGVTTGGAVEELNENYRKLVAQAEEIKDLKEKIKEPKKQLAQLEEAGKHKDEELRIMGDKVEESTLTLGILRSELLELQIQLIKSEAQIRNLNLEHKALEEKTAKLAPEPSVLDSTSRFFNALPSAGTSPPPVPIKRTSQPLPGAPTKKSFGVAVLPPKGKPAVQIQAGQSECNALAFSPNGASFATGGADKVVRIWDSATAKLKTTLAGPDRAINSIAFSQNDEFLLAASNDHCTRIWSLSTSRVVHNLMGHLGKVITATFSQDSQKVITGSHDRTIRIWDIAKGISLRTIMCDAYCNDLCVSLDGHVTISGHLDGSVRFYDNREGKATQSLAGLHTTKVTGICLSPDGNTILTNSRDNSLKMIDLRTYQVSQTFKDESYVCVISDASMGRCCFSSDGKYIVAGSNDGAVFLWNTATGATERKLQKGHKVNVPCVAWNPNGTQFATGDRAGNISLWQ